MKKQVLMEKIFPDADSPTRNHLLAWLPALLQITDSAYPIGGFAHSGGLEGMVALEYVRQAEDLRKFLHHEVAETLACVELPLLHRAWLAALEENVPRLQELDALSEAVRFAAEQRQASRRLGCQRMALCLKLQVPQLTVAQQTWFSDLSQTLPHKHLSVIIGAEAALLNIPVDAAMLALAHQTVMMVTQAAMKIMRIGQNSVQTMVAGMTTRYPGLIAHAKRLDLADLGTCLPQLDLATAWHETAPARMFLS